MLLLLSFVQSPWRTLMSTQWWSSEKPFPQKSPLTSGLRARQRGFTDWFPSCSGRDWPRPQRRHTRCTERWAAPSSSAPNSRPKSPARTCFERRTPTTGETRHSDYRQGSKVRLSLCHVEHVWFYFHHFVSWDKKWRKYMPISYKRIIPEQVCVLKVTYCALI